MDKIQNFKKFNESSENLKFDDGPIINRNREIERLKIKLRNTIDKYKHLSKSLSSKKERDISNKEINDIKKHIEELEDRNKSEMSRRKSLIHYYDHINKTKKNDE